MRARVGSRRRAGALGSAVLFVMALATASAQAVPSNFLELDGNVVFNGQGAFDWANGHTTNGVEDSTLSTTGGTYSRSGSGGIFNGGHFNGNTTPPTPPAVTTGAAADNTLVSPQFKVDPLSVDTTPCGTGDPTVYTGAGSETNGDLLSTDTFGTGSVPNKDDLSNVYAAAHINPSSSTNEVFFGAERVINNGDSHIDFEFLQGKVSIPSACSGSFSGNRTQGDFLLSVDFTTGGSLGGIALYKWQCDSTFNAAHDGLVCNPPAHGQSVPHYASTGTTAVKLIVNGGASAIKCGGWVCRNPDGSPTTQLLQNELMEGGIDLAQLGFSGCVSTFLPHTRSSQSFTATLKDFEIVPFSTCAHPTITTAIADSGGTPLTLDNSGVAHVALGTTLRDTSTLHGAVGTPIGSVAYTLYPNSDCTGTATDLGTFALDTSGNPPPSNTLQFNNAGTYYFYAQASFTDNRNLGTPNSGCSAEPVVVAPDTPSITTAIKLENGTSDPPTVNGTPTVPIGTVLRDTSTLSGQSPNATGTVTYALYDNSTCTGPAVSTLTPTPAGLTGTPPQPPPSNTFTFTNAGPYWFYATYSGDANNTGPVNSGCSSEPLVVTPNQPTLTTQVKLASDGSIPPLVNNVPTVPIGTSLYDTATLSGQTSDATGSVSYALYDNSTCTGPAIKDLTPTPSSLTGTPPQPPASTSYTFTHAGSFWFAAVYSPGTDTNNLGASSDCASEPVVVVPNQPTVSSLPVVQIKDTFTVNGLTSDATGNVVVGLFSDSGCASRVSGTADQQFLLTGNVTNGSYSSGTTFYGPASGTYYYKISYAGDTDNSPFSSCAEHASASVTGTS